MREPEQRTRPRAVARLLGAGALLWLGSLAFAGPAHAQGHILDGDTVALWRLDEASAAAGAVDETGSHNLTQFGSPEIVPGPVDTGRRLDGSSKYFQGPGDAGLGATFNGDWTYEGWVFLDASFRAQCNLFIYNGLAFSFNPPDTILAEVGILGDRRIYWHQWHSTGAYTEISSNAVLELGRYYHVAVSRTAMGGNLYAYRIYVNGVLDTTTTDVSGLDYAVSGTSHYIGLGNFTSIAGFGVGGNVVNGRLDDTRISRVARTDAEILESYRRGSTTLSVGTTGTGLGTVQSQAPGIACGQACTGTYPFGSSVTLRAIPAVGSFFTGWSGDACARSSLPVCVVPLDRAMSVNADFTAGAAGPGAAAQPQLALHANGGARADVLAGEQLAVTLALDCGDWCGADADWWVWADTPSGPISWSFAAGSWSPGINPAAQGALGPLAGTVVLESAALAEGGYQFHFSLDAPDGFREPVPAWTSLAEVEIGGGFFEDFEDGAADRLVPDPATAWKVAAPAPGRGEHGRRVYRLLASGDPRVFLARTAAGHDDFAFAADVRLTGGGPDSSSRGMGLVFRGGRGYGNGYVFHINARGSYFIFKRAGGATLRLGAAPLTWVRSDAIRTGRGAWNRLEVVCVGDRIAFLINGTVVRAARDSRFPRGRVGLKAFGDGANADRVEFDNVMLRLLPGD